MHNIETHLKELEKNGIDRREFMKILGSLGILSFVNTQNTHAFSSKAKGKIVIIGGGAAGISMAARLTRWLDEPDITLIDPNDRQYYQPGFTLVASGVYQPEEVYKSQESCMPDGIKWIKDSAIAVDPIWNIVTTGNNDKIPYDFLVLTPGIQINFDKVEGITRETLGTGDAHCIYDFEGAKRTWKGIQEFTKKGGRGIYCDTYTKHKCGGAPKKICLLSDDYARKQKTRDKQILDYYTASDELYDVPYFTPRLLEIYKNRDISITLHHELKGIDTSAKKATFEKIEKVKTEAINDTTGKTELIEQTVKTPLVLEYDFMHFLPPMSAPDFVREADLGWTEGKLAKEAWVMTDKETLVHMKYDNIISLGDCAGIPTSKTSAAVRIQVPVAAKNLISLMEGKEPLEKYNGYAACPIITEYGKVLMCEFDYDKKPLPTMPFIDASKEQWASWLLKVYFLKPMYFYGMLKGYM